MIHDMDKEWIDYTKSKGDKKETPPNVKDKNYCACDNDEPCIGCCDSGDS